MAAAKLRDRGGVTQRILRKRRERTARWPIAGEEAKAIRDAFTIEHQRSSHDRFRRRLVGVAAGAFAAVNDAKGHCRYGAGVRSGAFLALPRRQRR